MYPNIFQKLFVLLPIVYPQFNVVSNDEAGNTVENWDYKENGADWEGTCASGIRQSPIRLSVDSSLILPLPRIYFGNYDVKLQGPLTLTNNGHTVEMEVTTTLNGEKPYILGGLMKGKYLTESVHFHWGSPLSKGAEHVINQVRYDVEMHIVHRNSRYATVAEAKKYPDGVAVLGVMFKAVKFADFFYPGLRKIFTAVSEVTENESEVDIPGTIALSQLLGDLNTRDFYTYKGSLTTPGCEEAVTWTVFNQPLPMPRVDLSKLWQVEDHDGEFLENNYRIPQPRNNRAVFYHSPNFS